MKIIQQKLLGILTSFYEGMPNIVAEYILNGCFPFQHLMFIQTI